LSDWGGAVDPAIDLLGAPIPDFGELFNLDVGRVKFSRLFLDSDRLVVLRRFPERLAQFGDDCAS
jgi:hypothetical protein